MHNYNFTYRQQGLSLIELMVALALGIIVIFGITTSLVSISQSSRIQNRNADLQETADAALSYVAFRMRNALSTPCERYNKIESENLVVGSLSGSVSSDPSDPTQNETIDSDQATTISDLITGLGISVTGKDVSRNFSGTATNYRTDDITLLSIGDRLTPQNDITFVSTGVSFAGTFIFPRVGNKTLYAVTDCEKMNIFRAVRTVASGSTSLAFPANTIESAYRVADLSIVSPLDVTTISIDDNARLSDRTLFIPSGGSLMDNVELMRIIFGIDIDKDGVTDRYVTSSELAQVATAFSDATVLSADIYVLVSTSRADRSLSTSYSLSLPDTATPMTIDSSGAVLSSPLKVPANTDITFTDQVQRKVFMRSVVFRNNAITL